MFDKKKTVVTQESKMVPKPEPKVVEEPKEEPKVEESKDNFRDFNIDEKEIGGKLYKKVNYMENGCSKSKLVEVK